MERKCKNCKFWDKSETSIFGGWCTLGVHLQEDVETRSGVAPDDHCFDWEEKK